MSPGTSSLCSLCHDKEEGIYILIFYIIKYHVISLHHSCVFPRSSSYVPVLWGWGPLGGETTPALLVRGNRIIWFRRHQQLP